MIDQNRLFMGIDLGFDFSQVSLYHKDLDEPQTISMVAGEERYQIPMSRELEYAVREPKNVLCRQALFECVSRILKYSERTSLRDYVLYVAITVPYIDQDMTSVMEHLREDLKIPGERFLIMDYKESFFGYAFAQEPSVWAHDLVAFYYNTNTIYAYFLHRLNGVPPQVASGYESFSVPQEAAKDPLQRDVFFTGVLKEALAKNVVSSLFFVGDGFDGNWMNHSIKSVGANKRLFAGKNLFTKGACYVAYNRVFDGTESIYLSDYKFPCDLCMRVSDSGNNVYISLLKAGDNWFEHRNESLKVMYNGSDEMEFMTRTASGRKIKDFTLKLSDLPERDVHTLRFNVDISPKSGYDVGIKVSDNGFGELFPPTNREWNLDIRLDSH